MSGAVGGPNGGGSQPWYWGIPAGGAIAGACILGGEEVCAGVVAGAMAVRARSSQSGSNCPSGIGGGVQPNFEDPSIPPGPGWEWYGNGPPGSPRGAWFNHATGQSLHPDLDHAEPIGPHYDYIGPDTGGRSIRIYPGEEVPEFPELPIP